MRWCAPEDQAILRRKLVAAGARFGGGRFGRSWRAARRRCGPATRRACARTPMVEGRRRELTPVSLGVVSESSPLPLGFRRRIGRLRRRRAIDSSAMRWRATSVIDVCPGSLLSVGGWMRRILCRLSPGWPATHERGNTAWVRLACGSRRVVNNAWGFRVADSRTRWDALRPSYCWPQTGRDSLRAHPGIVVLSPPLGEVRWPGAKEKWRGWGGSRAICFTFQTARSEHRSSRASLLRAVKWVAQ